MSTTETTISAEARQRQELLERICASRHFRRATKLQAFLRHICEKLQSGEASELKEHEVGTAVFGRKLGYNMGEDNIVRVQARVLRSRLDRYFSEEGAEEPLVLRVPIGGYVPEFIGRGALERPALEPEAPPAPVAPTPRRSGGPLVVAAAAALALLAVALMVSRSGGAWPSSVSAGPTTLDPEDRELYLELLGWPLDRQTLVVLSNPRVLTYDRRAEDLSLTEQNRVPIPSSVHSGLESSLNNQAGEGDFHFLEQHPFDYTGMGEAASAYHIGILMERLGLRTRLTQGRFLDWEHARTENLIVLGSPHINDWTLANLSGGDFRFGPGGVYAAGPDGGEPEAYLTSLDASGRIAEDYGVISLFDLGTTKALILAGRSSAGTYGVGEFFFDPQKMQLIVDALTPNGKPAPAGWQALIRLKIQEDLPVHADLVRVGQSSSPQPPEDSTPAE